MGLLQSQQPQPQAQPQAGGMVPSPSPQQAAPAGAATGGQPSGDGSANMNQQLQSAMGSPQGQPQQGQGGDLGNKIDAALSKLPDEQKQFIAVMTTPEVVHYIGILFGPQIADALTKYSDPNTILVPMNRQDFMQHMQNGGADQGMQSPDEESAEPVDNSSEDSMEGAGTMPMGNKPLHKATPKSELSSPKIKTPKVKE